MSAPVPIGQTVVPIFPGGQQDQIMVYNAGSSDIYLGNQTGFNVGNGFPLKPGSTATWGANKPLYAVCAVGQTSLLAYNPAILGYTNPADIASAIISQGLATDIAAKISVSGAPPINKMDLLDSETLTVPASGVVYSLPIDAAKYQSIYVYVEQVTGAFTTVTPVMRSCNVIWFDNYADALALNVAGAVKLNPFANTDSNGYAAGTCYASFWLPCYAPALRVNLLSNGTAANVTVRIYGSYRNIEDPTYTHISGYGLLPGAPAVARSSTDPREGLVYMEFASKPVGAITLFPSSFNGRVIVRVEAIGVTAVGGFRIIDLDTGGTLMYLYFGAVAAGLSILQDEINLGTRCLSAQFDSGLTTSNVLRFSITNPIN